VVVTEIFARNGWRTNIEASSGAVHGIGSCGHPNIEASLLYWARDFISGFGNIL